ncbi:hypothetical protein ABT115_15755 [Streptomyces sp. NPDC001832]|uniref:hypothetical protein n=1 Tax=Streptomyces sp. NPDC001832 TaxID=3154527 RepID=UPI003323048D
MPRHRRSRFQHRYVEVVDRIGQGRRADELRDPGDVARSAPVTDRELELAETLIGSLPGIEESELQDRYEHALEQLVTAKLSGGKLVEPLGPAAPVDLMAALEESIQAARARRGH